MKSIPLSHLTFSLDHIDAEKNTAPSKTEPNQALSLQELLKRYSRGQSVPTFEPVYDDDPELPDLSKLSKIEMMELGKEISSTIEYEKQKLHHEAEFKKMLDQAPDPEQPIDFSDPDEISSENE